MGSFSHRIKRSVMIDHFYQSFAAIWFLVMYDSVCSFSWSFFPVFIVSCIVIEKGLVVVLVREKKLVPQWWSSVPETSDDSTGCANMRKLVLHWRA